jgi:hypothetical protein
MVRWQMPVARGARHHRWAGRPVSDLEKHPILMTFPVVRTTATDGTEIRDYVNGKTVSQCSSGGTVFAGYVSMATYSGFTNCMQNLAACHGIFYIKNGIIDHVSAIGTGGMRCYTDATLRPTFSGSAGAARDAVRGYPAAVRR